MVIINFIGKFHIVSLFILAYFLTENPLTIKQSAGTSNQNSWTSWKITDEGNKILKFDGFFITYSPDEPTHPNGETALVVEQDESHDSKYIYYMFFGDFRLQYQEALVKESTLTSAFNVYRRHKYTNRPK